MYRTSEEDRVTDQTTDCGQTLHGPWAWIQYMLYMMCVTFVEIFLHDVRRGLSPDAMEGLIVPMDLTTDG